MHREGVAERSESASSGDALSASQSLHVGGRRKHEDAAKWLEFTGWQGNSSKTKTPDPPDPFDR